MKRSTFLLASALTLSTFSLWAGREVSFTQNLSVNVEDAQAFIADVGAGSFVLRGADVDEITVEAKVYSKKYSSVADLKQAFDKKMILSLKNKGKSAELKALSKKQWFSTSGSNIAINLEVQIPHFMSVELDDGSGSIKVSDIAGHLDIDDGSGSIVIKNIGDNVTIDDGSGSINIKDVAGNVRIDDGSGSIDSIDIAGDFTVDDGSGSIKVDDLAGDFNLIDDGSGSIYVNGKKWVIAD